MDEQQAHDLVELLDDIIGRFGSQGLDGYCCEDISYIEYRALRVLAKGEASTVQRLGQLLNLTKSGATRVVDRIEQKGYAHRERNEVDHRVCCVTLTADGQALVNRILNEFADRAAQPLVRMDADMRDILLASLRSFVRACEDEVTPHSCDKQLITTK